MLGILGTFGLLLALLVALSELVRPSASPPSRHPLLLHARHSDGSQQTQVSPKGAAIAGGTGLFVAGYSDTLKQVATGLATGSSGQPTRDPIHGNSLAVEYRVDEQGAAPQPGPAGCQHHVPRLLDPVRSAGPHRQRARPDSADPGHPYHPLSARHHIDFKTPVKQALLATSGYQEGLDGRSTACARGNAMLEQLDSPQRVTRCLKRVGPRGSGRWQSIPFEQLVAEVVEGRPVWRGPG